MYSTTSLFCDSTQTETVLLKKESHGNAFMHPSALINTCDVDQVQDKVFVSNEVKLSKVSRNEIY